MELTRVRTIDRDLPLFSGAIRGRGSFAWGSKQIPNIGAATAGPLPPAPTPRTAWGRGSTPAREMAPERCDCCAGVREGGLWAVVAAVSTALSNSAARTSISSAPNPPLPQSVLGEGWASLGEPGVGARGAGFAGEIR